MAIKINMIVRVISKPEVQKMLTGMRQAPGLDVQKITNGYTVTHKPTGTLLFRASNATNGYLVRMADNLFA
jgi:hypothetical protein